MHSLIISVSESESEPNVTIKFYHCHKNEIVFRYLCATTEASDTSRITSVPSVYFFTKYLGSHLNKEFDTIHIFSDWCSLQFQSQHVFRIFLEIQKGINITWHYFEARHGKGPMDGIESTMKNIVFRKVLPGSSVINTLKQFAEFVNILSTISCLSLLKDSLLEESNHFI